MTARRTSARRRARTWVGLLAATSAAALALPGLTSAATAESTVYAAESVPASAVAAKATAATAAAAATGLAAVKSDLKVGVYPDSSTWTNNGITSYYLQPGQSGSKFPLKNIQNMLAKGVSANITITAKGTSYLSGIASGSSSAMSWLNAYIANIKTVSNYSASLNNGTYVVAALQHEAVAAVNQGLLTGSSTSMSTVGKAQQIAIRLGKQNAPNAAWSAWIVGYNRSLEATQLAQMTNPKPDLITWDPYENHDCGGTLSEITSGDLAWIKQQPAYNGAIGLSETGISNTCSDSAMATFYKGLSSKMSAFDPDISFLVVFNSNAGGYNHTISTSSRPQAVAALKASLTR